ncbi:glutamine--fructose-6-phosphate transaminase (isomerizing) [Haloarcula sp. CBA1130]|uniref:glutamine--fructose-6-phosphate transaminase (isomerizing) n=1 Tax=unclassified Haloarcula TaxID=2624677 RepID=UPI0012465566|nr:MULTISPECIES: glutamine--fructose-6-phosphate transaminase (isomerizing) [unclassified Haloarcula]KAA9396491.1 glutamine--fructose-6-phosphate transaminase (isomerizing) [Haloarcula sp. CBA1130]KAA9397652.1 glutamine--fructose-6-phosphate transaminase (isomerizing) [Haloarcula sp. CBA1129]
MCGIIGYVGAQPARPRLVAGLQQLEYRGYDSAGIALVDDGLSVFKQKGLVGDLDLPADAPQTCGIGHTRWSTHGKPTDANAHPHTDCDGRVAVVHNGIIANYDDLREELPDHEFRSETDTEVVAHLLEAELEQTDDLLAAVETVVDRIEGSYALGVVAAGYDGIIAARRNSPLVVGYGEDGNFIASDVTPLLAHTRSVSYLEDGDVAHVTRDSIAIRNDGETVDRPVNTIEWDADAAEKGGYDHYMLKEIHEQPTALRQAVAGRLDPIEGRAELEDLALSSAFLQDIDEIQFVACGTSYHACLYAKELVESLADVRATAEFASEYSVGSGRDPERTLVVGVSQSGETADTLRALRMAGRTGIRTLAVTNNVGSTMARECDDAVYIRAGPEIGVAATKTFASQVVMLALFALTVAETRGELDAATGRQLVGDLQALPGAVQGVLDDEDAVAEVANAYADGEAFFFIGRQLGHPVALEGALKLKEISYDHAEGFPAGELKHGPLALVTEATPVLALLTDGTRPEETQNNVKEVQSRGAPVIAITNETNRSDHEVSFEVPDLGLLEPLVANVYLQMFAYHVANNKERAIDRPRNLAKSVTVE